MQAAGSRGAAVELMIEGIRAVCLRLWLEGRINGVLCLGGAEGALLGAAAMHALPVGVPKLIVSPSASGRRGVRPIRRRERRPRHAFGHRHPRPQSNRALGVRQCRRGCRRDGARRGPAGKRAGGHSVGITMLGTHDAGGDADQELLSSAQGTNPSSFTPTASAARRWRSLLQAVPSRA